MCLTPKRRRRSRLFGQTRTTSRRECCTGWSATTEKFRSLFQNFKTRKIWNNFPLRYFLKITIVIFYFSILGTPYAVVLPDREKWKYNNNIHVGRDRPILISAWSRSAGLWSVFRSGAQQYIIFQIKMNSTWTDNNIS